MAPSYIQHTEGNDWQHLKRKKERKQKLNRIIQASLRSNKLTN